MKRIGDEGSGILLPPEDIEASKTGDFKYVPTDVERDFKSQVDNMPPSKKQLEEEEPARIGEKGRGFLESLIQKARDEGKEPPKTAVDTLKRDDELAKEEARRVIHEQE